MHIKHIKIIMEKYDPTFEMIWIHYQKNRCETPFFLIVNSNHLKCDDDLNWVATTKKIFPHALCLILIL
jgi:hypothetical protein